MVQDTDWDTNGEKYSYGRSTVSTLSAMEFDGRLGVILPIKNRYAIEVGGEVWYSRYVTVAHDGWIQHVPYGEPWNDSAEREPLYGTSISYIQEWIVIAPAIGFRINMDKSQWGIRVAVSPGIWGNHIDHHYFRKLESEDHNQRYIMYEDKTRGYLYYHVEADYIWTVTASLDAGLVASYRNISGSRGDTQIKTTGLAGYLFRDNGMAGAATSVLSIGAVIKVVL
jgi:outer membrane protease